MPIVVISSNAGTWMGGEAIKAFQFFNWLMARGADACLLTHTRNRDELTAAFGDRVLFVEDDALQRTLWRSRVFEFGLIPYFHMQAARVIRRRFAPQDTVLHYLCPISPVEPRFAPRGYRVVIGPLNGNVFHPPGFRHRMSRKRRLAAALQAPAQRALGLAMGDKRRADRILVAGGERTRASLRLAGVADARMSDVLDAGISPALLQAERIEHAGRNARFLSIARLVNLKAIDLILRAMAHGASDMHLTLVGDGPEEGRLRALADSLGLGSRVAFLGHVPHDQVMDLARSHRALVFPSLCEANGIAMQEAMALGLPVIALNWGGQSLLADDQAALFVQPTGEARLTADLADAMTRIADDAELANRMSRAARDQAQAFSWDRVAASWTAPYADLMPDPA